eukprot:956310-Karenia_brevis.AAC.1
MDMQRTGALPTTARTTGASARQGEKIVASRPLPTPCYSAQQQRGAPSPVLHKNGASVGQGKGLPGLA